MKKIVVAVLIGLLGATMAQAQIESPRPSPNASLTQTVGLTDFTISYSRPGVKGRTIFGDLVPYGKIWRTGANHCTVLKANGDFVLAGNAITAGEYGVYTIPGKEEWTIIISEQNDLWGTADYTEEKDVVRFKVKPQTLSDLVESFTIDFSNFTDEGATLTISWEKTIVKIPVTVDTDAMVMAQIEEHLLNGDGKELNASSYHNAAVFYHKKGKDLDQALEWMNKSIELNPKAFYYLYRKAKLLADMGEKKEAIKTAEASLEMAKANKDGDFGYAARNEALIAELKNKKKK